MEKNISTIIFDFGNVLIDLDIRGFNARIRELTGLHDEADIAPLEERARAYERGELSTELFINNVIKLSRHPLQARQIIDCWNSMLVGIRPETLHLLTWLKNQYATYILSNTNPLHIQWVYEHLRMTHQIVDFEKRYLHGAFYSYQVNLIKPDPRIYERVVSDTGTSPENILFLDDLEQNVLGAHRAGWNAVIHPPGRDLMNSLTTYITLPERHQDDIG